MAYFGADGRAVPVGFRLIAGAAVGVAAVLLVAGGYHRHERHQPPAQAEIELGKKYCPVVNAARATGVTDEQIIAMATAMGVSSAMIAWAQKNCVAARLQ